MRYLRTIKATENVHDSTLLCAQTRILRAAIAFVILALMGAVSGWAATEKIEAGAGKFAFTQAGKTVPVWYYVPQDASPDAPVLFVMHGVKRDAGRYRDEWMPHAQ